MIKLRHRCLVMILFVASCHGQTDFISVKDFAKVYKDSLSRRFPGATFKLMNDSTIAGTIRNNDLTISVDNAYREYCLDPDNLAATLSTYLKAMDEATVSQIANSTAAIVPVLKPVSSLNDTTEGNSETGDIVYERYNNDLIIQYVIDSKNSMRHLHVADLTSMGVARDTLRQLAIRNLDHLLTSIVRKGSNGVFTFDAGGDYESGIILLDSIFVKDKLPVKGDFVIAIPNRNVLLVTGSKDPAGLAKIGDLAAKLFDTGSYPLSPDLFRWNGKIFERLH